MTDRMRPVPFEKLLDWIDWEYKTQQSIFGIPQSKFYYPPEKPVMTLFGEPLDTPLGPSAGPHTQLAQNIVASYLTGGRVIELKTVQILDALEFPKPCIHVKDECYNTEWSTELSIDEAFCEYVKAWFLLYLIQKELFDRDQRGFIFNMSVGYNLEGIKSEKVNRFIEGLKDASQTSIFQECKNVLLQRSKDFPKITVDYIEGISPHISSSIALSTMHGCPPDEIEAICRYMLQEKQLHTLLKMNPTLLGYPFVRDGLAATGYTHIQIKEETFAHDLHYVQGIQLLKRIKEFALTQGKEFGVKLSNTLPVRITEGELPGEEMYMSGRALYPLTVGLAFRIALEFDGNMIISYSGGADRTNIEKLYRTGIRPITVTSVLLKPHGYLELKELADILHSEPIINPEEPIDLEALRAIAFSVFQDEIHARKELPMYGKNRDPEKIKTFGYADCFCRACSEVCPNRANVIIKIKSPGQKDSHQVVHLDGLCNECGTCIYSCPQGNTPYRDKFTLFWSEEDFYSSANSGVFWIRGDEEPVVKVRLKGEVYDITLKADSQNIIPGGEQTERLIRGLIHDYRYLFCR